MKFIRKNGRIIPIGAKNEIENAKQKTIGTAKQAGKNAAQNGINKAIEHGNDAYNSKLSDKQKMQVHTGMSIFEKAVAAGSLAGGAKSLISAADRGAASYQKQAREKRGKYSGIAASGAALGIGGAGAIARGSSLQKVGKQILKYESMKLPLNGLKSGSSLLNLGKKWKIGGSAGAAIGTGIAALGLYGARKAAKHEARANNIRNITSSLKKYSGG